MFNLSQVIGSGNTELLFALDANLEGSLHSVYVENTLGMAQSFSIFIGTKEVSFYVGSNESKTIDFKMNIPANTTVSVDAPIGLKVTASYISQPIDANAALNQVQEAVAIANAAADRAKAAIPSGSIDDSIISASNVWSAQKTSSVVEGKASIAYAETLALSGKTKATINRSVTSGNPFDVTLSDAQDSPIPVLYKEVAHLNETKTVNTIGLSGMEAENFAPTGIAATPSGLSGEITISLSGGSFSEFMVGMYVHINGGIAQLLNVNGLARVDATLSSVITANAGEWGVYVVDTSEGVALYNINTDAKESVTQFSINGTMSATVTNSTSLPSIFLPGYTALESSVSFYADTYIYNAVVYANYNNTSYSAICVRKLNYDGKVLNEIFIGGTSTQDFDMVGSIIVSNNKIYLLHTHNNVSAARYSIINDLTFTVVSTNNSLYISGESMAVANAPVGILRADGNILYTYFSNTASSLGLLNTTTDTVMSVRSSISITSHTIYFCYPIKRASGDCSFLYYTATSDSTLVSVTALNTVATPVKISLNNSTNVSNLSYNANFLYLPAEERLIAVYPHTAASTYYAKLDIIDMVNGGRLATFSIDSSENLGANILYAKNSSLIYLYTDGGSPVVTRIMNTGSGYSSQQVQVAEHKLLTSMVFLPFRNHAIINGVLHAITGEGLNKFTPQRMLNLAGDSVVVNDIKTRFPVAAARSVFNYYDVYAVDDDGHEYFIYYSSTTTGASEEGVFVTKQVIATSEVIGYNYYRLGSSTNYGFNHLGTVVRNGKLTSTFSNSDGSNVYYRAIQFNTSDMSFTNLRSVHIGSSSPSTAVARIFEKQGYLCYPNSVSSFTNTYTVIELDSWSVRTLTYPFSTSVSQAMAVVQSQGYYIASFATSDATPIKKFGYFNSETGAFVFSITKPSILDMNMAVGTDYGIHFFNGEAYTFADTFCTYIDASSGTVDWSSVFTEGARYYQDNMIFGRDYYTTGTAIYNLVLVVEFLDKGGVMVGRAPIATFQSGTTSEVTTSSPIYFDKYSKEIRFYTTSGFGNNLISKQDNISVVDFYPDAAPQSKAFNIVSKVSDGYLFYTAGTPGVMFKYDFDFNLITSVSAALSTSTSYPGYIHETATQYIVLTNNSSGHPIVSVLDKNTFAKVVPDSVLETTSVSMKRPHIVELDNYYVCIYLTTSNSYGRIAYIDKQTMLAVSNTTRGSTSYGIVGYRKSGTELVIIENPTSSTCTAGVINVATSFTNVTNSITLTSALGNNMANAISYSKSDASVYLHSTSAGVILDINAMTYRRTPFSLPGNTSLDQDAYSDVNYNFSSEPLLTGTLSPTNGSMKVFTSKGEVFLSVAPNTSLYVDYDNLNAFYVNTYQNYRNATNTAIFKYKIQPELSPKVYDTSYHVVKSSPIATLNTSRWTEIHELNALFKAGTGAEVNILLSTNGDSEYFVTNGTSIRKVVRVNLGFYEINVNSDFAFETWVVASNNTVFSALKEAMSYSSNKLSLGVIDNYDLTNVIKPGLSLDFAITIKSDGKTNPNVSSLSVAYSALASWVLATYGQDYSLEQIDFDKVKITPNITTNIQGRLI